MTHFRKEVLLANMAEESVTPQKKGIWTLYREVRMANVLVYLNFAGAILKSETGSPLKVTIHQEGEALECFLSECFMNTLTFLL